MKVYLDDQRQAPSGWVRAYTAQQAIDLLELESVKVISLDHDLGDDLKGTGYDVVLWIEEAVITRSFTPPKIIIHTANPSARVKMELGVVNISKLSRSNLHAN